MNSSKTNKKIESGDCSTKSKPKRAKSTDLAEHAFPYELNTVVSNPLTMDGTSHTEISLMANKKYSTEIINDATKLFNIEKLHKLKSKNANRYRDEGKKQILGLWQCNEALMVHTALFTVSFQIAMGIILNDIEDSFEKKAKYMAWLRSNFGSHHLRYFQHAKQLAKMGDFARSYASLGKNRLLEYARIKRQSTQSYEDILKTYPFEDTAVDHDGVLFNEHIDSIITYHRLIDAGVKDVEFDQAALIAAHSRGSITVKNAKGLCDWLEKEADKKQALDDYILNLSTKPYNGSRSGRRNDSLIKHLAELIKFSEDTNIDDDTWIQDQKEKVSEDDLVKAHRFIVSLAEKFQIELTHNENASVENAEEGR